MQLLNIQMTMITGTLAFFITIQNIFRLCKNPKALITITYFYSSSTKFTYQDKKVDLTKLRETDPKKAEQMERLGMAMSGRLPAR